MSREQLIRSTQATSLGFDANVEAERDVDRITALALATRRNAIGGAEIHAEALDAASLRKVWLLLARSIIKRQRTSRSVAEAIALAVLREHMQPGCRACGGLKHHYADGKAVLTCPVCEGSGDHRYSDTERAEMVGVGAYPRRAYEFALGELRDAIARAVRGANARLTDR